MKGIRRVSTRNMSRPEWLARRRNTIGGSDAAAIVGLSRYGSQYSVFMLSLIHISEPTRPY